jgi:hypothetical protein
MGSLSVDSSTTHIYFRKIMPNVRRAIMWCFQVWRKMDPKPYEIGGGYPRFYLQIEVPIVPWMMNMRNQE